jgi:hypothetical protein
LRVKLEGVLKVAPHRFQHPKGLRPTIIVTWRKEGRFHAGERGCLLELLVVLYEPGQ